MAVSDQAAILICGAVARPDGLVWMENNDVEPDVQWPFRPITYDATTGAAKVGDMNGDGWLDVVLVLEDENENAIAYLKNPGWD